VFGRRTVLSGVTRPATDKRLRIVRTQSEEATIYTPTKGSESGWVRKICFRRPRLSINAFDWTSFEPFTPKRQLFTWPATAFQSALQAHIRFSRGPTIPFNVVDRIAKPSLFLFTLQLGCTYPLVALETFEFDLHRGRRTTIFSAQITYPTQAYKPLSSFPLLACRPAE
jgi:hypothetical protein